MIDGLQDDGAPLETVWRAPLTSGGDFAGINRPVSGATHQRALPVGDNPLQLYAMNTPNGQKVAILLEELLAAGYEDAAYDGWLVDITRGEQFGDGFVALNPNSKIPVLVDRSADGAPEAIFESGSILFYLAEKFGAFLPTDLQARTRTMNWLMWQVGSTPLVGGGFGHFFKHAPHRIRYAIDRFTMETKRQLHVLDTHLGKHEYVAGAQYTIADMAIWPWYGGLLTTIFDAQQFLNVQEYRHLARWTRTIGDRPAVMRACTMALRPS